MTRADDLTALFERGCAAMMGDDGGLPPGTAGTRLRGRGMTLPGAIAAYGGATRFALAVRGTWGPSFAASFPDQDAEPV